MIDLYNGDCLEVMDRLIDKSVKIDLVVTSPPYNVDLGNNKYNKNPYNLYNDNKEHWEYIEWLRNIFSKLKKIVRRGGRIAINIGDGKNGAVPTHSDIIQFMKELSYIQISTIIWNKNQVSSRTAWGSWLSPSCPSFPTPFEYILIFGNENKKLQTKGETDLTKQEFISNTLAIWNIAPETNQKKIGHPAMYPVELPKRLIKMLSWKDATILDPFMGSGTTGIACKELDRDFIGIELNEKYFELAKSRIENYKVQETLF